MGRVKSKKVYTPGAQPETKKENADKVAPWMVGFYFTFFLLKSNSNLKA